MHDLHKLSSHRALFLRFCRQAGLAAVALSGIVTAAHAAKLPDCTDYPVEQRILCYIDYIQRLPDKSCDCQNASQGSRTRKSPPKSTPEAASSDRATKPIQAGVYVMVRHLSGKNSFISPGEKFLISFGADGDLDFGGLKFRCNKGRTFCYQPKIRGICQRKGSTIKALPGEERRIHVLLRCDTEQTLIEYAAEKD